MINGNECIKKDDLTDVACKAETLSTLLADVDDQFFGSSNSEMTIKYDFKRLRRYISLCLDLSFGLTAELHKNEIWCFDRKEVA